MPEYVNRPQWMNISLLEHEVLRDISFKISHRSKTQSNNDIKPNMHVRLIYSSGKGGQTKLHAGEIKSTRKRTKQIW